jgi:Cd2+/Zn2+-exporting ATPase/Cu+-exporting ATPase
MEQRTFQIVRLILVGFAALFSLLGLWRLLWPFDLVAILATLIGGYPIYRETFHSLARHRRISMEVSMTVAIAASLIVGAFFAALVITFFVLLAEFIEGYAIDKARSTITQLEKVAPKKALVRRGGLEVEVDPQTLAPGDVVIVRDGERIPVDGVIVKGSASVNQAAITGEALPAEKDPGGRVYAGSVNESGLLEVETESVGKETVFGKIVKLIGEAQAKRAPIQKLSDRLATWLIEFAIGFSLVTLLLTRNPISSISVIVVAGSCGVAAGTPLAIVAAMGKAAKRGVIVKGGVYIEEMSRIDTIVIDKTGTLTMGEPEVAELASFDGCSQEQLLSYAAMAEKRSTHPIARAIARKASELGLDIPEGSTFNYLPGRGVVSNHNGQEVIVGNAQLMSDQSITLGRDLTPSARTLPGDGTKVFVAHDGRICGILLLADAIRGESRKAIADLRRMGIETIMLTGDNAATARTVGRDVGVNQVYSELMPQDKVAKIEDLVASGRKIAMVGDGINDAPALARANVGIGMGAGTDVAVEEADLVLMTNDLRKIADMVKMSKRAYGTIMHNFYGTVAIDGLGVFLAFLGLLNPLLAALIHTGSEFVFIMNSARLLR